MLKTKEYVLKKKGRKTYLQMSKEYGVALGTIANWGRGGKPCPLRFEKFLLNSRSPFTLADFGLEITERKKYVKAKKRADLLKCSFAPKITVDLSKIDCKYEDWGKGDIL